MSLFSCISSERSDVHSVNVQVVQNSCHRMRDVPVQLYLQWEVRCTFSQPPWEVWCTFSQCSGCSELLPAWGRCPCSAVSLVRGPMYIQSMFRLFRTPASVRKMSLFSCISSEGPQSPATFPPQRLEALLNWNEFGLTGSERGGGENILSSLVIKLIHNTTLYLENTTTFGIRQRSL